MHGLKSFHGAPLELDELEKLSLDCGSFHCWVRYTSLVGCRFQMWGSWIGIDLTWKIPVLATECCCPYSPWFGRRKCWGWGTDSLPFSFGLTQCNVTSSQVIFGFDFSADSQFFGGAALSWSQTFLQRLNYKRWRRKGIGRGVLIPLLWFWFLFWCWFWWLVWKWIGSDWAGLALIWFWLISFVVIVVFDFETVFWHLVLFFFIYFFGI